MTVKSLEDRIQAAGGALKMLRTSQTGAHVYPVVPPEFSNWRDEQRAWQQTAVLFDQSYHMTDLYVKGPDALKLLSDLGTNSFKGFQVNQAKQYAPCTEDGYVVGDVILTYLDKDYFNLIGRPSVHNWVTYHAEKGKYNVELERDDRAADQKGGQVKRKVYRFQVQGPNALATMEKVLGKKPPELKFFHMTEFTIAGRKVRALRHGMAGQPGFELWGPYEEKAEVRNAILEAGKDFGLKPVGARTYASNTLESGWIPSPMPAIYSGEKLKDYRQWLPANGYEGNASLGGSFDSPNIEDYYLTPYDLGYGIFVKFDHDFIGRSALEKHAKNPRRKKVTLALHSDDVLKAMATMFQRGDQRAKYFDMPSSVYATLPYDKVTKDGKTIGISTWVGYSSNERRMLTLAMVDVEYAEPGTEVIFHWGEPNSVRPTVEPHVMTEIRAMVSPVPYAEVARKSYADGGWRAAQ
ncbi:MAG: aminomethyl transferase family protein [Steroidobacteraceae bacterium]|nr:aminomethyl transferase family protein [Steroidobacteraceae bacterium]